MGLRYPGNSPSKDRVRSIAYDGMSASKFRPGMKQIVIVGGSGDIRFLKLRGVAPLDIIACDQDESKCRSAWAQGVIVPPKPIRHDIALTVEWAVMKYGEKAIASVNNDLCNNLIKGAPIMQDVSQSTPVSTDVFFTFSCYHDKGLGKGESEEIPGSARIAYLKEHVSLIDPTTWEYHRYVSYTDVRQGSPMCMAISRGTKK